MDTTAYEDNPFASGQIPIEKFIPREYLQAAKDYKTLFESVTLTGNVKPNNRTPEQIKKDEEAIELLKELGSKDKNKDPAIAYGFMLYDETSITKIYWANRVNRLRYDKSEFFSLDRYLEWLTAVSDVLLNNHPKIFDPLYYYKVDTVKKDGTRVGYYDVMNSFRVQWNRTCLVKVAYLLRLQDKADREMGMSHVDDSEDTNIQMVSYEGALENENGAGNHLEAQMSANGNFVTSNDDEDTLRAVETFLKSFVDGNLSGAVPFKSGTKAAGMTYRDYMIAIIDGSVNNVSAIRNKFILGQAVQARINAAIESEMTKCGITLQDLANYLADYKTVALDILNGIDNSFANMDY